MVKGVLEPSGLLVLVIQAKLHVFRYQGEPGLPRTGITGGGPYIGVRGLVGG